MQTATKFMSRVYGKRMGSNNVGGIAAPIPRIATIQNERMVAELKDTLTPIVRSCLQSAVDAHKIRQRTAHATLTEVELLHRLCVRLLELKHKSGGRQAFGLDEEANACRGGIVGAVNSLTDPNCSVGAALAVALAPHHGALGNTMATLYTLMQRMLQL